MTTRSPTKRKATTRRTKPVARDVASRKAKRVSETHAPTFVPRNEASDLPNGFPPLDPPELRFYGVIYIDDVEVWRGRDCYLMMEEYLKLRDQHLDKEVGISWLDSAPVQMYAVATNNYVPPVFGREDALDRFFAAFQFGEAITIATEQP